MDELPALNPAHVDELRQMVAAMPYPALIGMRLDELAFDRCSLSIDIGERHLQGYGIVHGGVLATLIDSATWWAAFARLPEGRGLVSIDLKLNYLKSLSTSTRRVVAEGRCVRAGRTINYCEAYVRDTDGQLVAHGTSSLMAVPDMPLTTSTPKFLT